MDVDRAQTPQRESEPASGHPDDRAVTHILETLKLLACGPRGPLIVRSALQHYIEQHEPDLVILSKTESSTRDADIIHLRHQLKALTVDVSLPYSVNLSRRTRVLADVPPTSLDTKLVVLRSLSPHIDKIRRLRLRDNDISKSELIDNATKWCKNILWVYQRTQNELLTNNTLLPHILGMSIDPKITQSSGSPMAKAIQAWISSFQPKDDLLSKTFSNSQMRDMLVIFSVFLGRASPGCCIIPIALKAVKRRNGAPATSTSTASLAMWEGFELDEHSLQEWVICLKQARTTITESIIACIEHDEDTQVGAGSMWTVFHLQARGLGTEPLITLYDPRPNMSSVSEGILSSLPAPDCPVRSAPILVVDIQLLEPLYQALGLSPHFLECVVSQSYHMASGVKSPWTADPAPFLVFDMIRRLASDAEGREKELTVLDAHLDRSSSRRTAQATSRDSLRQGIALTNETLYQIHIFPHRVVAQECRFAVDLTNGIRQERLVDWLINGLTEATEVDKNL